MVSAEVVAASLEVPEGPIVIGAGAIAFVEQARGRVSLFDNGKLSTIAEGPGSPNALALGDDGFLYAAQNGGVVGTWRSPRPCRPAVERVGFDGTVAAVVHEVAGIPLGAPNDLVFGPDGRLYLTDPGEAYEPSRPIATSRLFAIDPGEGEGEVLAEPGLVYANGIAFLPVGTLCWVESYARRVCTLKGGERRVLCQFPAGHVPDGLAVAADGRLFVATVTSHGVSVVSPDGELLDHLHLDDDALPTNCCFEGSALWVTDFGTGYEKTQRRGRLWRVETDAVGAALGQGHP